MGRIEDEVREEKGARACRTVKVMVGVLAFTLSEMGRPGRILNGGVI
jgi:hypothetical protein